ncbi:MAG: D-alanine--D-alanine ligase, partial [Candidatus Omnitrophica bacterium]|nr:D-alanine--D-alanine ligase [Candidatus Omnitrophota bacterium]
MARSGSRDSMVDELKKYRIAVLRGGPSSERDISLLSGESVIESLTAKGFNVVDLIVPETKDCNCLKSWVVSTLSKERIDICFIILHGWFGEDGLLQKILDEAGYPYTGSSAESSGMAMDKITSKTIFQKHGIPTPKFKVIDDLSEIGLSGFNFPLVVKPSAQGSSLGVFKVETMDDLKLSIQESIKYDGKVLIEEFILGSELTVGILNGEPLPVIEIVTPNSFYNYSAKYTKGQSSYVIPARISHELESLAQDLAVRAHNS